MEELKVVEETTQEEQKGIGQRFVDGCKKHKKTILTVLALTAGAIGLCVIAKSKKNKSEDDCCDEEYVESEYTEI